MTDGDIENKGQMHELVQSCISLSKFEDKSFKALLPQIVAAFIAISYHIVIGISFAYSAILIPQLLDAQNSTGKVNDTETVIRVTETDIAWIASVLPTVVLPASIIGGILTDSIGRLNTIKLAAIPNAIGWILIAVATNIPMLVIGRMLTGTSIGLGASPAIIYTTEISTPSIRGALVAIGPCLVSFGMMMAYLEGSFFHWRIVAWICLLYTIVPITLITIFLPESPTWLVSKNRLEQAKKSLEWLNRYRKLDPNYVHTYTEVQYSLLHKESILKQEQVQNVESNWALKKLKMFVEPTVYKPLLILIVLYLFQQFSGLFIMLFYAISFFKEVGTDISAYLAAVLVGAVRFFMSVVAIYLMKRYKRRSLMIVSGLGMTFSMGISGIFTELIKEGKTTLNWIPVVMILLYVASSMVGFLGIPWTIIGELFPTSIRGIAHSIAFGMAHIIMFASIQLYFTLTRLFGGMAGLQYFFAIISFAGVLYSYIFLPETHNKKLSEIQEYFKYHSTYFSLRRVERNQLNSTKSKKSVFR